jgi:hypothetical protein
MKKAIPNRCYTKKYLQLYIFEFMWRRSVKGNTWRSLLWCLQKVTWTNDKLTMEWDGDDTLLGTPLEGGYANPELQAFLAENTTSG